LKGQTDSVGLQLRVNWEEFRVRCKKAGFVLGGVVLTAQFVFAADRPSEQIARPEKVAPASSLGDLVTDRPDFTESAEVVGLWVLQFEGGATVSGESPDGVSVRTFGTPFALVRLGITEKLELRFGTDGYLQETTKVLESTTRVSGMADVGVGAKLKLLDEGETRPNLAIIPAISLPSGSQEFTSSGYDPSLNFAWAKSLPKGFGLGGNVKFQYSTEDEDRFFQHAVSFSLGLGLFGDTAAYGEVYQVGPITKDGHDLWMFDAGLTHALGNNAQLDLSVGRSLSPTTPNWFVGVGFAIRSRLR
jgi:hypothetical protein